MTTQKKAKTKAKNLGKHPRKWSDFLKACEGHLRKAHL